MIVSWKRMRTASSACAPVLHRCNPPFRPSYFTIDSWPEPPLATQYTRRADLYKLQTNLAEFEPQKRAIYDFSSTIFIRSSLLLTPHGQSAEMINTDLIKLHLKAFGTGSNPVSTGQNTTHKDFQQDAATPGKDDTPSKASGELRTARDIGDERSHKFDYIAHLQTVERQTEGYAEKLRRRSL